MLYAVTVTDGLQEEFRGFSFVNKDFNPLPPPDKPPLA